MERKDSFPLTTLKKCDVVCIHLEEIFTARLKAATRIFSDVTVYILLH